MANANISLAMINTRKNTTENQRDIGFRRFALMNKWTSAKQNLRFFIKNFWSKSKSCSLSKFFLPQEPNILLLLSHRLKYTLHLLQSMRQIFSICSFHLSRQINYSLKLLLWSTSAKLPEKNCLWLCSMLLKCVWKF